MNNRIGRAFATSLIWGIWGATVCVYGRDPAFPNLAQSTSTPAKPRPRIPIDGSDYLMEEAEATPLMRALRQGDTSGAKRLIAGGADVNVADPYGLTALMIAAADHDEAEIVEELLGAGASVNARSRDGETALFAAAFGGNATTVKELVQHGADVNASSRLGVTPLMEAAQQSLPVIQFLVVHGANVNAKDVRGQTALMMAARAGRVDIVRALVKAHADVNARDVDGGTALSSAGNTGHTAVARLLKQAGARD